MERLASLWASISEAVSLVLSFLRQVPDGLAILWEGSKEETGVHIFIAIAAVAVGLGLLALLISFLKASWKEKLHRLLVTLIALLIIGVILWYGLKDAGSSAINTAITTPPY